MDQGVGATCLDKMLGRVPDTELKWIGNTMTGLQHYKTSPVECDQLLLDKP